MEDNEHYLSLDCLIGIFSFLPEEDLMKVSCVCKEWHGAAETQWLWRALCLRRWTFCNAPQLMSDTPPRTWKRYYLHRSALERNMTTGRSGGDYSCTSLRGHTARIVGFSYLKGNRDVQDMCSSTPVVCSASADGTVRAWDVHRAVPLWSSSSQNPLTCIVTDPEQEVVVTGDSVGTISAWQGRTGALLSSFSCGVAPSTLTCFNTDGNAFVTVGSALGSLLVLTSPLLSEVWRRLVCDSFSLNLVVVSPDNKWILTTSTNAADFSPKVFSSRSVCSAGDEEVCVSLSVSGCCAAAFFPSHPARVAVVHGASLQHKTLSVFEFHLNKSPYKQEAQARQVESFPLQLNAARHSEPVLRAKGSGVILLADGAELKVYSVKGDLISSFKDHLEPITSVCVDAFRVVTASRDLSLRVLTWTKEPEKDLTLQSRYQLLGGSHTTSRGFSAVACDYASVVASADGVNGRDVLKAYVFHS